MKLHHAAALALVGWYLMTPPMHQGSWVHADINAPLKDWTREAAFDTAPICEAASKKLFESARHDYHLEKKKIDALPKDQRPKYSSDFDKYPNYRAAFTRLTETMHPKCVETGDPRLK